jgi:hypothetical protein
MAVEHLLSDYLFRNKVCPLPTIGTLFIDHKSAILETAEKQINPPVPVIILKSVEIPAEELLNYIADENNITIEQASGLLSKYCNKLQDLDQYSELDLPHAGTFYVDNNHLSFRQAGLPKEFFPPVYAERVIHPDASHAILVGDRETTNTVMSEFYNEEEVISRRRWWILPLLLFIAAVVTIIIYFNDNDHSSSMGNAKKVVPETETKSYNTIP